MPRTAARMNGMPSVTLSHQVMTAPNVTISPWAKLVSPVVP